MVYLNYIIALFLGCLSLGLLIVLFSKNRVIMGFGYSFLVLSGIILISSIILTSDAVLFVILGFLIISVILFFTFRDYLESNNEKDQERSENNE